MAYIGASSRLSLQSVFRELRDDLQQIVNNRMPGPNPPIVVLCDDWFLHDVETGTLVCRDAKPSTVAKMKKALSPNKPFPDRIEKLVLAASIWPRVVEQALTELRDEKLAHRKREKNIKRNIRERQKRRNETTAQKLARQQARRVQDDNRTTRRNRAAREAAAAAAAAASPEV